jgi:hypothetical protein
MTEGDAERVRRSIHRKGNVNLLLTQFGYARWIGNEEDVAAREEAARLQLASMRLQISYLNPELIIPYVRSERI